MHFDDRCLKPVFKFAINWLDALVYSSYAVCTSASIKTNGQIICSLNVHSSLQRKTFLISVFLVGGDGVEGYVYAYNPENGITGPICGKSWDIRDVSQRTFRMLNPSIFVG